MTPNPLTEWETYRDQELEALGPHLEVLGIRLDEVQPHIKGERFLMQAVTTASGRKLILFGKTDEGVRVVIKATRDRAGAEELRHERTCRALLKRIRFAYKIFHTPEELYFIERAGFTISVQRYIDQPSTFIDRPLREQFDLALSAFKAQEGAHAATYEHVKRIRRTFGSRHAAGYFKAFESFKNGIAASGEHTSYTPLLKRAGEYLRAHEQTIEQYTGFLTHTDFVPHNIRIVGSDIYLLDHSSLRFGNKYEGWARFLNFMALYNPALEEALTEYVRLNRAPEELEALTLMRVYRLAEIMWYYAQAATRSDGNLAQLNKARVAFWAELLEATLEGRRLSTAEIEQYKTLRDSLRSEDEKARQIGLH